MEEERELNKFNIKLTLKELSALRQILDIAVKSAGLEIAETVVVLDKRIREEIDKNTSKQNKE